MRTKKKNNKYNEPVVCEFCDRLMVEEDQLLYIDDMPYRVCNNCIGSVKKSNKDQLRNIIENILKQRELVKEGM